MKHDQTVSADTNPLKLPHTQTRMPAGKTAAALVAAIISSVLLAGTCVAADRDDSSARARYEQERERCNKGETNQSKETCLREAGAARQQAKSGSLTTASEDQLQRNRELRCNALPPTDRDYCLQRMRGAGTQSGSAERGGILRELVVPVKPGQ
ncbi:hypothetical protein UNDYM_3844 [Undibacterium sp. YM2]|uniref:hypothetical protein n=1 Tax=Undibacterium sp. YM2 TaxID=2058625 RepID=UPI001331FB28|nr:hypothetical protein [Undibacterium sp. YM2]BBB68097.1 hypothetical protein UNDYM_3844 [Undibacterium sp. YM2]